MKMVNFNRLKKLIAVEEQKNDLLKRRFFEELKAIATEELKYKQIDLKNFGG